MERHFVQNLPRCPKRHLNSSPSFDRKQPRLCQQKSVNENRSFSSITKSEHLLNSYFREFHLSDKDYLELRQALKRIFDYLQPKIHSDEKQRLTSPYLKRRVSDADDQSLPLYTNEYFIRNGLLNHNDGPEIYDEIDSKPIFRFESSLPLELLSNQKYLLTALTGNFVADKQRRWPSSLFKSHENETESMVIRRKKVQTWERENILQQKISIAHSSVEENELGETSEHHRSSLVRTPSINQDEKISSSSIFNEETGYDQMKTTEDLFPFVKKLGKKRVVSKHQLDSYRSAPYIVIRNSFHLPINKKKSSAQLKTTSERRSSDTKQPQKKNYLLAEFESVLTLISKN